MKILISAYACEPNIGSEQGIGWNWSHEIARRGHQVWVITRKNNRKVIEDYFSKHANIPGLTYVYYDLPEKITTLKPLMGVYIYYELWQRGIVSLAKKLENKENFDLVHHLTFGVFRQNTFLYKLRKPLYIGPVGGGEITPKFLNRSLPLRQKLFEQLRHLANKASLYNPSR